jgi:hypothetical protein
VERAVSAPASQGAEALRSTPCTDAIYLGRKALLLAANALGDFPVAFALTGGFIATTIGRVYGPEEIVTLAG